MRILTIIFLLLNFNGNAQDGFDLIRKAERKIERGKLSRAEQLLDKADSANYGFCGTAGLEAREAIILNRVKIADSRSDTMLAIDLLSNTRFIYRKDMELLRHICVYQQKEEVKEQFRTALLNYNLDAFSEYDLPVSLSFREEPVKFGDRELFELLYNLQDNVPEVRELLIEEFFQSEYAGGLLK